MLNSSIKYMEQLEVRNKQTTLNIHKFSSLSAGSPAMLVGYQQLLVQLINDVDKFLKPRGNEILIIMTLEPVKNSNHNQPLFLNLTLATLAKPTAPLN
jgi:hypothetical protein